MLQDAFVQEDSVAGRVLCTDRFLNDDTRCAYQLLERSLWDQALSPVSLSRLIRSIASS